MTDCLRPHRGDADGGRKPDDVGPKLSRKGVADENINLPRARLRSDVIADGHLSNADALLLTPQKTKQSEHSRCPGCRSPSKASSPSLCAFRAFISGG